MAASGYTGMYTCKADLGNGGKGSREGSALFVKDEALPKSRQAQQLPSDPTIAKRIMAKMNKVRM